MARRSVLLDLEGEVWTLTFLPTANLLQIEVGGQYTGFHPGLTEFADWTEEQWAVYQQYQQTIEGRLRAELLHAYEGLSLVDEIPTVYELVDEFAVRLVLGRPLVAEYQVTGGILHGWQGHEVPLPENPADFAAAISEVTG